MSNPLTAIYLTHPSRVSQLVPKTDKMNYLIPMKGYYDKNVAVEEGIVTLLKEKYNAESVTIDDTVWTVDFGVTAPLITKTLLGLQLIYLYEAIPLREHRWVHYPIEDFWTTIYVLKDIRRCYPVQLYDYFNERKLVINHPRMR